MATLTETAYYARRTINWLILGIIAYFILKLLWGFFIAFFIYIFPPRLPPPDHKFGKLPAIKFPDTASPSAEIKFRLETIEGSVPKASNSAYVYFMPKAAADLMALTNTQKFAARLGFDQNPIPETKNLYLFNDPKLSLKTLRYDIISNNFIVKYAYEQDLGLFDENNVPSLDEAKAEATSMLQTYELYQDDFRKGPVEATYLKLSGDQLMEVPSLSQANAVRVDFFRNPIGDMLMRTPNPNEGTIEIIFSGAKSSQDKRVLQFAYTYWPVDYQTFATYKLKTSADAWQELQSGKGYIPNYPASGNIVVREVHLAYYDAYEPQMYLQPIFVFEGDENFVGYVPAVAPPWTE